MIVPSSSPDDETQRALARLQRNERIASVVLFVISLVGAGRVGREIHLNPVVSHILLPALVGLAARSSFKRWHWSRLDAYQRHYWKVLTNTATMSAIVGLIAAGSTDAPTWLNLTGVLWFWFATPVVAGFVGWVQLRTLPFDVRPIVEEQFRKSPFWPGVRRSFVRRVFIGGALIFALIVLLFIGQFIVDQF